MKCSGAPPFAKSIAVAFLLMPAGSGMVLAQGVENPAVSDQATQPGRTKVLQKQRDSAAPRGAQDSSNVRAKRKPNEPATAPDTSYNTITNTPPSARMPNNRADVNNRTNAGSTTSRAGVSSPVTPTGTNGEAQQEPAVQSPTRKTNLPESMQIQQNTVRALPPRQELITKGGSSAPPSAVNSPVEQNRLDSSAPSRQRLQIDDLSARQPQQPNAPLSTPSTANPAARGTVSSNGASGGTSGGAVSGTPSGVSPASPAAASGSSPSTSSHSSGGSSSGGSH